MSPRCSPATLGPASRGSFFGPMKRSRDAQRSDNQIDHVRVPEVRIHSPPGERCYGAGDDEMAPSLLPINLWSALMAQPNDLSRSLVALDQNSTIIAVVEMSQSSWLVGGVLPGIERQPRKKLEPSPERLLALLHRWRDESVRSGRTITRSRPRRLLAGALAEGARGRGARDPSL